MEQQVNKKEVKGFENLYRNMELLRLAKSTETQEQASKSCGLRNPKRWATIVRTKNCHLREIALICAYYKVSIDDMVGKTAIAEIKFI